MAQTVFPSDELARARQRWLQPATEPPVVVTTDAASLPSGPRVDGSLFLFDCPNLVDLGELRVVTGDLRIRNCPKLRMLPPGLDVRGALNVRGCSLLSEIPRDLRVGGDFVLIGRSRVRELDDSPSLEGSIVLKRAALAFRRRRVAGTLALIAARVSELPDDLHVAGDLFIRRCLTLRGLPHRLRVDGGLEWRYCPLRTLPADVEVRDFIDVEGSPELDSVAAGLVVPGWMRVRNCRKLVDLGEGLQIGVTAPRRTSVWSPWLYANLGPTTERRRTPMPGSLDLTGCERLTRLPDTLRATSIEVAETALAYVPAACETFLRWRGVAVPAQVVLAPETYRPEQVLRERNAEVRRVLIERLGLERFIGLLNPELLDRDTDPGGPRELLRVRIAGDREPYVALRCRCPSTGRTYLLRVPPTLATCRAAAAWLAGFDNPDDYAPLYET